MYWEEVCFVQGGPSCKALSSVEVYIVGLQLERCGGRCESRVSCPFTQLMVSEERVVLLLL